MNVIEVWKDVVGYEGEYKVSNFGRVKSCDRKHKGRILKTHTNAKGYHVLSLSKNGIIERVRVHRLVATAFLENNENLPCVNHKDENRINNNVYNLEWCTYSYNNTYNDRSKRVGKVQGKLVEVTNITTGEVDIFDSTMEVERNLGIRNSKISECCLGKRKTYKGYRFKYI